MAFENSYSPALRDPSAQGNQPDFARLPDGSGLYGEQNRNNAYGSAPYGNGAYGNPGYGSMPYGNARYGNPAYGNAQYGNPAYGRAGQAGGQMVPYQGPQGAVRAPQAAPAYGNPMSVVAVLTGKWRTSATIWMIIGVLQVLSGLATIIFGVGFLTIVVGVWNIVQASKERNAANQFSANPSGILRYSDSNQNAIVSLLLNLFLGAVIGVIGAIYDMSIQSYANAHRQELWQAEQMRMGGMY